jgi:hypothetical protein
MLSTQVSMRPLVELIRELPTRDQEQHVDELIRIFTPLFRRAQADGELLDGAQPSDIRLMLVMIDAASAAVPEGADGQEAMQRLITVVLNGFFPPCAERAAPS